MILKPWTRYFLYLGTLPIDIVGWIVISLLHALFGIKGSLGFQDGVLFTTLSNDSWFVKGPYKNWGGTTIGHAIIIRENQDIIVNKHERKHVIQNEATGLAGFVLFLVLVWTNPIVATLIWVFCPSIVYLAAGLVAAANGKSFYENNLFEEAADDVD
jgi:hypothetical protein